MLSLFCTVVGSHAADRNANEYKNRTTKQVVRQYKYKKG